MPPRTLHFCFTLKFIKEVFGDNIFEQFESLANTNLVRQSNLWPAEYGINCFNFCIYYLAFIFSDQETNDLFKHVLDLISQNNISINTQNTDSVSSGSVTSKLDEPNYTFLIPTTFAIQFRKNMVYQLGLVYSTCYFISHMMAAYKDDHICEVGSEKSFSCAIMTRSKLAQGRFYWLFNQQMDAIPSENQLQLIDIYGTTQKADTSLNALFTANYYN